MEVGERRAPVLGIADVAPPRELPRRAAEEHDRQVVGRVGVAVAHARAVHQDHVVEQRAVAVGRRPQLLDEAGEEADVIAVDLGQLAQRLAHPAVVRQRVVGVGHLDLRIGAAAQLVPAHERRDPGAVGLVGQELQVVHQPGVLGEVGRGAHRPRHQRHLPLALGLGHLDAPLDVAHRVEIGAELQPVAGPEAAAQADHVGADRVENAALLAAARLAGGGVGGLVVAEEPLEHRPRVVLHRQRGLRVAPRDGVREGATEPAAVARAGEVRALQPQLQGRQRRVAPELAGRDLVHRDRLGVPRAGVHVGEEAGRGARVAAAADARRRRAVQPRQHQKLVAERGQRLENRRQLEAGAGGRRRPALHDHAVGHVDGAEPHRARRRARAQARHHAVEERQGHARSEPPQHRAARNRPLRDERHDSDLLSWNGTLSTMPRMIDDQRYPPASASRTMRRIAGWSNASIRRPTA